MPIQSPFTNTKQLLLISKGVISSNSLISRVNNKVRTIILLLFAVIFEINVKFLTSPTGCPSGVSQGHKYPQLVPCNLRGLTIFPLLPVLSLGEFTRRKCDTKL